MIYRCYFHANLPEGIMVVVFLSSEDAYRVDEAAEVYGARNHMTFLYKELVE